ncbi:hypothetical protein CASFOL_033160 [Castilleja foliolosa]|uniref:TF-B3 domain-containing protein n=1 Tax=Castilleja foliolosa TaxID=1961234 RepID=A0ABD3C457_9LAMI
MSYPQKEKATDILRNCESAMERAQEIQNNLASTSFSCSRLMLRSHVSGGFWLGLPREFCKKHLPKNNTDMVLVDEDEKEYPTVYKADRNALSGGWKRFAKTKNLVENDVCVFELVKQWKIKVHIVRASEFESTPMEEVNAARFEPTETAGIKEDSNDKLTLAAIKMKKKRRLNDDNESLTLSEPRVNFKDVKCFDSFKIEFHGVNLDSKIPAHLRKKYYELCKSQENFLHKNLNKGLNINLAARVISETIEIADAIRAAKLGKDTSDLKGYDKTLEMYQFLGMKVGFLRARIDKLMGVSRELKDFVTSLRNKLKDEEDKFNAVKAEITGTAKSIKRLVDEIRELEAKNDKSGVGFADVAGAPW